MKIEHFRYLLEINRLHSISAAARSLHVGQTTLSSAVKAIETELGFPVFQRAPDGVTATADGKKLMEVAWNVNVKYEELTKLRDKSKDEPKFIFLPMCPVAVMGIAIPLAERFYRCGLNRNLSYTEYPSSEIYPLLASNAANIGIAFLSDKEIADYSRDTDQNGIKVEVLFHDRMYLFTAKNHRLADREYVEMEDIAEERIALVNPPNTSRPLGGLIAECRRVSVLGSLEVVKQAVLEQNMVNVLPGFAVQCDGAPDLEHYRMLPIKSTNEGNSIWASVLYRGNRSLRYHEEMLLSCIRELFDEDNAMLHEGDRKR